MSPIIEPGDSINSIPLDRKIERFGQIQKVVFQRVYSSGTTKNTFIEASANPNVKASWTPLITATDGTKITTSPFISEPESEPGEARTYGGGNATLNGIELILGSNPTPFDGKILESPQHVIAEMKKLRGETLGVYFINEYGQIGMLGDGKATIENYYPIPVHSFHIGDKGFGNFEGPDANPLHFAMPPNWSDNFQVITPTDFNALHDLHDETS